MPLFGKNKPEVELSREDSLSARPVVNSLVRVDKGADGLITLQVPRKSTSLVRVVSRYFKLPPYRRVALDELGTFVIELCDGEHTVRDIVDKFSKRFKLNRREAEISMGDFLRTLARRSIIALVIKESDKN